MEVFSSMQANDIAVSPGGSEGVRVFRDYLEYAATGKIETGTDSGRQPESPFEEHVLARLRTEGLEVDPQVGVAGYRVDLGIRHPEYPHGYLLGVECDGRTYHSAQSVRDRDRLREAVLRGLGWDIYRIWSTDWFRNADGELARLMEYIRERVAAYRSGLSAEEQESVLAGAAIRDVHMRRSPEDVPPPGEKRESAGDEQRCVEVGDTVSYHESGRSEEVRRVSIVRGADDMDNGIVHDGRPLAIALMGAGIGDTVTVRHGTGEVEVVVAGVDRPEPEDAGTAGSGTLTWTEGVDVLPYAEWCGFAPDPRSASVLEVAGALMEVVEKESPVVVGRAYQALMRASELQRLGPQIRQSFDRALRMLESEKRVVVERAKDGGGYSNAVLRMPDGERVRVRELGPRSFVEIPRSELLELVRIVRRSKPEAEFEEICREVLSIYGLVRMTEQVRKKFRELEDLL